MWLGMEEAGSRVGELQSDGVIDVHLVAREGRDGEPFAVWAEDELIRIGHRQPATQFPGCRIEEQQLVTRRVADQQELVVRSQR